MPDVPTVPDDGPAIVEGVELPVGHQIEVMTCDRWPPRRGADFEWVPRLWTTDDRLDDAGALWWSVRRAAGTIPVLLDSLHGVTTFGQRRPWDAREELQYWHPAFARENEVEGILSFLWDKDGFGGEPFTSFPGLAPLGSDRFSDEELSRVAGSQPPSWLGLVPADRSADVPVAAGWFGTVAPWGDWAGHDPAGAVTAILRSWEDRFGATVFRMGFARLHLLVDRPPKSREHALRVAAELVHFSDDFHSAEGVALDTVANIAAEIVNAPLWKFWWD
jgi:Domain of unknown function (DUF4253)